MRRIRAVTGLYLLAYVTLHLINLSLGLASLEMMDAARPYLSGVWSGPVLGPVLLLALLVHYGIGLWSVYDRPRIAGTMPDLVQAISGLLVIPLLAVHFIGVYLLKDVGVEIDYATLNRLFWLSNPGIGLTQVLLVSVVWVHGCAGLFTGLRAQSSAVRWLPWLYPLAVAIPVLALLGYTQAGRLVLAEGVGPSFVQQPLADGSMPAAIDYLYIKQVTNWVIILSSALGGLVLAARVLRHWMSRPKEVTVITQGVGTIVTQTGQTLLDAFRDQPQAHANLCAGRGRCGTCAVRILGGGAQFSPPSPLEQATLDRLNYDADTRLACQLHLVAGGTLEVMRILPPDFSFDAAAAVPEVSPPEVQA